MATPKFYPTNKTTTCHINIIPHSQNQTTTKKQPNTTTPQPPNKKTPTVFVVFVSFSTWRHPSVLHGGHHVYQSTRAFPPPQVPSAAAARFPRHRKMEKSPFPRWCRRPPVLEKGSGGNPKEIWGIWFFFWWIDCFFQRICQQRITPKDLLSKGSDCFFFEGSEFWVCFLTLFDALCLKDFFLEPSFFWRWRIPWDVSWSFVLGGWRTRVFGNIRSFFEMTQKYNGFYTNWLIGWSFWRFLVSTTKGSFSLHSVPLPNQNSLPETHMSHPREDEFPRFLFGGICIQHINPTSNQQDYYIFSG